MRVSERSESKMQTCVIITLEVIVDALGEIKLLKRREGERKREREFLKRKTE